MKKDVKRGLLVKALCVLSLLFAFSFNASAADAASLTVQFFGNSCIITGCDKTAEGELIVPAEISGRTVTAIGEDAFSRCKLLTDITLPQGVTEIKSGAFSYCTSLRRLVMADSVTATGQGVFSGCSSLEAVVLSDNITSLGMDMFYMCTALTDISLPQKLRLIGENAFFGCKSLKNIVLPEGVVSLCARSFSNCSALETLYIPSSLELADRDAFEKCTALNTVYYSGTQLSFEALLASSGNECLEYAEHIFLHNHRSGASVTTVSPTCTAEGYRFYSCPCGFVSPREPVAATGHRLTLRQELKAADCTTEGIAHNKCEYCDYYEVEKIPATGHSIVTDKAVAATCTAYGKTEGSHCRACGSVVLSQSAVSPLGHDFSVKIKDGKHLASAASYSAASRYYLTCSRCEKISSSETFTGEKLVLPKVKALSFSSTTSSVTLSWKKLDGVRGYAVYQKNSKGKWSFIKRVRANSIRLEDLPYGRTRTYAVRAYVLEEDGIVYAPEFASIKAATKPLPSSKITAKQNDKAVTLSWNKSKGATGYRVYKYDSKKEKWHIICSYTENNSLTVKDLKSGYRYKFSVRSCIDTGKALVWSKRSEGIVTCTKPQAPRPRATSYKYSVRLEWDKVKYADGYRIYVSDTPDFSNKKIKRTEKLSYKIDGLESGSYYYFKVYSYRVLSDGRIYSYSCPVKKIKTR